MSLKIKALLTLVLLCSEPRVSGVATGTGGRADDSAVLSDFLKAIDTAPGGELLVNMTSAILDNLCACIHDTLGTRELKLAKNKKDFLLASEDGDSDQYTKIYSTACDNSGLESSTSSAPRSSGDSGAHCSRFDFVRKFEDSIVDSKLKSNFKKIMFNILIKSQNRHKYEIKKYNLYEKPQLFSKNAMRSVIVIITLNSSKFIKVKTESSRVSLEEIDEVLQGNGSIYVDFIDPAYDAKNNKISSAKNVSSCNLQSVLTVLLESETNNLTKTFKLIRKSGTIKVYTSLLTSYAYEQYSDICCEDNTTSTFCKTPVEDFTFEENKSYKGKQAQVSKYKDTLSKIKTLIQIYKKISIVRGGRTEMIRSHYANLVVPRQNSSSGLSDQHFLYPKKLISSRLNKSKQYTLANAVLHEKEHKMLELDTFELSSQKASQLNNRERTSNFVDVSNNELPNTVEAEKIYLKVCNYNLLSTTTIKDSNARYDLKANNGKLQNISNVYTSSRLQPQTKSNLNDTSWTVNLIKMYPFQKLRSSQQYSEARVGLRQNKTDLRQLITYNISNTTMKGITLSDDATDNTKTKMLTLTRNFDKMSTKTFSSEETNRSFLKLIDESTLRTSSFSVLNQDNYESIMMNSLTSSDMNINKISKRGTTTNTTDTTRHQLNGTNLLEMEHVTLTYPKLNSSKSIHDANNHLNGSSAPHSSINSDITKSKKTWNSTKPTKHIEEGLRNRNLTSGIKIEVPDRFGENIKQKKASQIFVTQSQESKILLSNDTFATVSSLKERTKRNINKVEVSTTFLTATNLRENLHIVLHTTTELTTPAIYIKETEKPRVATKYSPNTFYDTSNHNVQKNLTTPYQIVQNSIDKDTSSQIPTLMYSVPISSSSLFKNYAKNDTKTASRYTAKNNKSLNDQTKYLTYSKSETYPKSTVTKEKPKTASTSSLYSHHSSHLAVEKGKTTTVMPIFLQLPTLLYPEPIFTKSSSIKNYTEATLGYISNFEHHSMRENLLEFNNSDRYHNSNMAEGKAKIITAYYNSHTYYAPSNVTIQKDRLTTLHNIQYFTDIYSQIPTLSYSQPNSTRFSFFKNHTDSSTEPAFGYITNNVKYRNDQINSLTNCSSERNLNCNTTGGKTKIEATAVLTAVESEYQVRNNLTSPTHKNMADAKLKKHKQENITVNSFNLKSFHSQINNLSNYETFTEDSFNEHALFSSAEVKSNVNDVPRITITAKDTSIVKNKNIVTVKDNKNKLFDIAGAVRGDRTTRPLYSEHKNTAPSETMNKAKYNLSHEIIANKSKSATESFKSDTSPIDEKIKTHIKNSNEIKETISTANVSEDWAPSYSLKKVASRHRLWTTSNEPSISIAVPSVHGDQPYYGARSNYLTSKNKIKLNKTTISTNTRNTNTIDISVLMQTPAISKLKLDHDIGVADPLKGDIDSNSRLQHSQDTTKTNDISDHIKEEFGNLKSQNKVDPTEKLYFKTLKRGNRIYDNSLKITQSVNSVAKQKFLFLNERFAQQGFEMKMSNKENIKIIREKFTQHITKGTFALPTRDATTRINNKTSTFYPLPNRINQIPKKILKISSNIGNVNKIILNSTGHNIETKPFDGHEIIKKSEVLNNTPFTYTISQGADNSSLPKLQEVVLTPKPIQNNTTVNIEPYLAEDNALDFRSKPNPFAVTLIPVNLYDTLITANNPTITTKGSPVTEREQSSSYLKKYERHSDLQQTPPINISNTAMSTTTFYDNQVMKNKNITRKDGTKSISSNKYSKKLSALSKKNKTADIGLKPLTVTVQSTDRTGFYEQDRDSNITSSGTDVLSYIENTDLLQSKKLSETKKLLDYKKLATTDKLFSYNEAKTEEKPLETETSQNARYSKQVLAVRQSKIANNITESYEIDASFYDFNKMKPTDITVPFVPQEPTRADSARSFISTLYNDEVNEITRTKNVLKTFIMTDEDTTEKSTKGKMYAVLNYSKYFSLDDLLLQGQQRTTGDTGSLTNTLAAAESAYEYPDVAKSRTDDFGDMELRHAFNENIFINSTTNSAFNKLETKVKQIKSTTQRYTHIPSPSFKESPESEKLYSNNSVKTNRTIFERFKEFQPSKTNRSEEFETFIDFKSQVNDTEAIQSYDTKKNHQDVIQKPYESTPNKNSKSPLSDLSAHAIEQSLNFIQLNTLESKEKNKANNTSSKYCTSNSENTKLSKQTLKTLKINETTVKTISDTNAFDGHQDLYVGIEDQLNNRGEPTVLGDTSALGNYTTTALNNVRHSKEIVNPTVPDGTPTTTLPPVGDRDHKGFEEYFGNRCTKNTDSSFRTSSPLLQNTQSLNSYNTVTKNPNLTSSSVGPNPDVDIVIDGKFSDVTKNDNKSLQSISEILSSLSLDSKHNSSFDNNIIITSNIETNANKTNATCYGPLIIAANIILLTNPEGCGNQSKPNATGTVGYPLIVLTNSSDASGRKNPNQDIINISEKMDPASVYNILFGNGPKSIKQQNKYLSQNNLSKKLWKVATVGVLGEINSKSMNTSGEKTLQAIAQSVGQTGKLTDVTTASNTEGLPAPHSGDLTVPYRATSSRAQYRFLVPSTGLTTKPSTDIIDINILQQLKTSRSMRASTEPLEKTQSPVLNIAYYMKHQRDGQNGNGDFAENKTTQNSLHFNKEQELKRSEKTSQSNNMEAIRNKLLFVPRGASSRNYKDSIGETITPDRSEINTIRDNNKMKNSANSMKMFRNKASSHSFALNRFPNTFHRFNKRPVQGADSAANTNTNRVIIKSRTDTTKENKIIKYNSYQPASQAVDVSLDSREEFALGLRIKNNKLLSNKEISLLKKFNHQTTDFKKMFKLGRKNENISHHGLQDNRKFRIMTEKLRSSLTTAIGRSNEWSAAHTTQGIGALSHRASRTRPEPEDPSRFTRKQRNFFTINTRDFFSQRRFYSKNILRDLPKARHIPFVLHFPVSPKSTHVVLKPVFRNYGVVNVRQDQNVPAVPNARKDATQYEKHLKDEEKSKLSLWQDKIVSFQNLLLDELKSNILEKPTIPAATERSVFDYLYNYQEPQGPSKIKKYYLKYLTGIHNNKIAKHRAVYRKKNNDNVKNTSTTTDSSTKRSRRTIFFLSPTVPYNRYF